MSKILTYVAVMWTTVSVCAGLINGHDFSQEEQDWWAVQPLRDSLVPEAGAGWARNEIDRFVAARLEAAGLIRLLKPIVTNWFGERISICMACRLPRTGQ